MYRIFAAILLLTLSACGTEVATTAAAVATAKAVELQQAEKAKQRVRKDLDAALQAGQQRLQAAQDTAAP
jgi:hypothetical protein